jgi:hypothetical protein
MSRTSRSLTKNLCLRISEADDEALLQCATKLGETHRTKIVRKLICELSGRGPYLLGDDLNALRETVREVRAVGVNLNQLMRAINAGQVSLPTAEEVQMVHQLLALVESVRREVNRIILRSRNRRKRLGL